MPLTTTLRRDGDRDIVFTGILIGEGEAGEFTARIYKTNGGKFVASLIHTDHIYTERRSYRAAVADNAAGIAEFYMEEKVTGDGKHRVTTKYLNDAGKLAMQNASNEEGSFEEHGFHMVE
jgi:hypothetical protein